MFCVILGFFYDVTGSYDISFYYAGTTICLAGVINLPLRHLARWREKRKKEKNNVVIHSKRSPSSSSI